MRFMVIVKATEDSEKGAMPSQDMLEAMGAYNEELVKAGVMLDGDGLRPSSYGARVRFDEKGTATVIDGPFTETKELVSGYWIFEVSSKEEAVEWARKAPFRGGELEIRPFSVPEDFGEAFTPELQDKENELRDTLTAQREA
ncbi:YciI family protein [Blastococcus sp. SYSU D01042]